MADVPPGFAPRPRRKKSRLSAAQRQRQRDHARHQSVLYNLTLDVNELRQQVRELEERRSLHATRRLLLRQRFADQAVSASATFFAVFRSGFRCFSASEHGFLAAHLHPNVRFASTEYGVELFLDQWRRYKTLFRTRVLRVSSIAVVTTLDSEDAGVGGCVLECVGEFEGELTRSAIDVVFEHVARDPQLVDRLEGTALVCPTKTLIYLDARGRIVEYAAHSDFFTALSRAHHLCEADVIATLAGAHISSEGSMIPALPVSDSGDDTNNSERHSLAYVLS